MKASWLKYINFRIVINQRTQTKKNPKLKTESAFLQTFIAFLIVNNCDIELMDNFFDSD